MKVTHNADRPTVMRADPMPTLQRLVDREAGSEQNTILINNLSKGQFLPLQTHQVEEIIVVIAGQCSVTVGDETEVLLTGDAVIVPPHTSHSLRHSGIKKATVLAVLATPDFQIK